MKISIFYKRIILALAIVYVSIIHGLPHLILSAKLSGQYTPFTLSPQSGIAADETYGYAGFANIVNRGYLILKDRYVYEYSNYSTPLLADNIPSLILGFLSKLTGSIEKAFIVSDFIFPPIIFLLVFILTSKYIKNFIYILAVSLTVTYARDLITLIPFPKLLLNYFTKNGEEFLYLSRTPHPQISLIFLLAAFLFFLKLLQKPSKLTVFYSGVLFGALFYVYFFYFSYFWLFLILSFLYFYFKKEKQIYFPILESMLIGISIGAYYIYNFVSFSQLEISKDFSQKMTQLGSPWPLTLARYLIIAIVFHLLYRKKRRGLALFLFLITAILIIPLVRILVGGDIETFHYVRFALLPFATVAFFAIVYFFLKNHKKILIVFSVLIITVTSVFALNAQISQTHKVERYHVRDINRDMVFDWLNKNTTREDVVGSLDQDFNRLASVYTKNYVYLPYTSRTIMPTEEGLERYSILSSQLGISQETQKQRLDQMMWYLFRYRTYDESGNYDVQSHIRKQAEVEIEMLRHNWQAELKKYKIDYIVVTQKELSTIRPTKFISLEAAFGEYLVFKTRN